MCAHKCISVGSQSMLHINVCVVVHKYVCTLKYECCFSCYGAHECMSGGTQALVHINVWVVVLKNICSLMYEWCTTA